MSEGPRQRFTVLTIFPETFPGPLGHGVIGRAIRRGLIELDVRDLRAWADPPHYQVDDTPFGGGAGMVMKPEPWFRAIEALRSAEGAGPLRVILLDPAGRRFDQRVAHELRGDERLVLLCGRYEGIDERVREHLADDELSVGDYVLTGGELAAMIVIEAVGRLVPGVVGEPESLVRESFEAPILDHPHYTRPAEYRGYRVPDVLLSGHHAKIERWRREQGLARTRARRPDLVDDDQAAVPTTRRSRAKSDE